jgi:hypothetical protein
MKTYGLVRRPWIAAAIAALGFTAALAAQATSTQKPKPFEPSVGQAGKDVVWVPTPQPLVEKMLDMAKVTPQDFVMDLGSGDGRTVITAAKRGARALGIEYNPDMVELSRKNAAAAGVSERATFQQADIFETDFSKATVITLFLLPDLNLKLRPKILEMRPGTRIVSNSFTMDDWEPDQTAEVTEGCTSWCRALMWIVPAKVEGAWKTAGGPLTLTQKFQMVTGTMGKQPITDGRLNGDEIAFTVGAAKYTGKVSGSKIEGTITGGPGGSWSATR